MAALATRSFAAARSQGGRRRRKADGVSLVRATTSSLALRLLSLRTTVALLTMPCRATRVLQRRCRLSRVSGLPVPPCRPLGPNRSVVDRLAISAPVLAGRRLLEAYREHLKPPAFRFLGLSFKGSGWQLHPAHTSQDSAHFINHECVRVECVVM